MSSKTDDHLPLEDRTYCSGSSIDALDRAVRLVLVHPILPQSLTIDLEAMDVPPARERGPWMLMQAYLALQQATGKTYTVCVNKVLPTEACAVLYENGYVSLPIEGVLTITLEGMQ